MSLLFRFPFRWGAPNSVVTVTPTVTSVETWSRVYASQSHAWQTSAAGLLPRFEHVYAGPAVGFGAPQNVNYKVQSEFPAIVATEGVAVVESSISNP